MTDKPFKPRAADYLGAMDAPPVPSSGNGRVVRVHRSPKTEPSPEELQKFWDNISWGYR